MTESNISRKYALIAVEQGIDLAPEGLIYEISNELQQLIHTGSRVVVPLGRTNRETYGWVLELTNKTSKIKSTKIKRIIKVDEKVSPLPQELLNLAKWVGNYYVCPIGIVVSSLIPSAVTKGKGRKTRTLVGLSKNFRKEETDIKTKQQLKIIQELSIQKKDVEEKELLEILNIKTKSPLKKLFENGLIVLKKQEYFDFLPNISETRCYNEKPTLTQSQKNILKKIDVKNNSFSTHLLFGVTGSGKTEIYFQLIEDTLKIGKNAIYLVPEITLTSQTYRRLIERFGSDHISILHSAMTPRERHFEWHRVQNGQSKIAVGARSAIFAPFKNKTVGLIVVDEEHDQAYKQDRAPRYHGRDVAIRRGQLSNATVILGSATPSLESWSNATIKQIFHLHKLAERAPGLSIPEIKIADRRTEKNITDPVGPVLKKNLQETISRGDQALLLLNRRGWASHIFKTENGYKEPLRCDHCSVNLVWHKPKKLPSGYLRCHHCLTQQKIPGPPAHIHAWNTGTQQLTETIGSLFPELQHKNQIERLDSDSAKGSQKKINSILERFHKSEIKILIGTQMIAKGLDFPGVSLVGVIDSDSALAIPDFRSSERSYQLLSQVTGRCGRGTRPAHAILQTLNPNANSLKFASKQDYEAFAAEELMFRKNADLPPINRMARLVIKDKNIKKAKSRAAKIAFEARHLEKTIQIVGPGPCILERIADYFREEIEIFAPNGHTLQYALATLRSKGLLKSGEHLSVDVDPISLL